MDNLFNFNKIEYIRGKKRPQVECILCAIKDKNLDVDRLEIIRTELSILCVNLYPYNSGHLMLFPKRHITDIRKLTNDEVLDIEIITRASIDVMSKIYKPTGFNIGYNIGEWSGASIKHIHRHIIPRYPNEIGFIDIIGGAKIITEHPTLTLEKFKEAFSKIKLDDYNK